MASSFQRELRRVLPNNRPRRSAAATDCDWNEVSAAIQPLERRSICRSRSRLTRTLLATSNPGTTRTIAAQNGGNGKHIWKYFMRNQEKANSTRPGENAAAQKRRPSNRWVTPHRNTTKAASAAGKPE